MVQGSFKFNHNCGNQSYLHWTFLILFLQNDLQPVNHLETRHKLYRQHSKEKKSPLHHEASTFTKQNILRLFSPIHFKDNRKAADRSEILGNTDKILEYIISCLGITKCRNADSLKSHVRSYASKAQIYFMQRNLDMWKDICEPLGAEKDEEIKMQGLYDRVVEYLDQPKELDKDVRLTEEFKSLLNNLLSVRHDKRKNQPTKTNLHSSISTTIHEIFMLLTKGYTGHNASKVKAW